MVNVEELLNIKKQQELTEKDKEKINVIEDILKEDGWMFKLDMDTVIGILEYLNVPEDKILETYSSLVSADNFLKQNVKERVSFTD